MDGSKIVAVSALSNCCPKNLGRVLLGDVNADVEGIELYELRLNKTDEWHLVSFCLKRFFRRRKFNFFGNYRTDRLFIYVSIS